MANATRPPFLDAQGKITQAWTDRYAFVFTNDEGKVTHRYIPTEKGLDFHESTYVNELIEGSRGTGKSMVIRNDAHMRALAYPGYTYLIVRRTMPELKKSHLKFMSAEMKALGGYYHKTDYIAHYANGSMGFFGHCETEDDMMKLLSSEYCAIYFDEITTFTWTMITKIGSCVRVPEGSGLMAIVRGGTNPIGVGAAEVRRYFITKDVTPEEDPDYLPDEWHAIHTTLDDNPYIDKDQYIRRLSNLPEHIRRAWLDGEWVVEGAYFHDYRPTKKVTAADDPMIRACHAIGEPIGWHVVDEHPVVRSRVNEFMVWSRPFEWVNIYRAIDWGFSPDPAVCLWIPVLPNGRAFVLKEKHWKSTPARVVAQDIVASSEGMRIAGTYCDPSMFAHTKETEVNSIGDIFESNGVPLTPSINDRVAIGFAIHEYLNNILDDGLPKIQIYSYGCPQLIRTFPEMRTHKTDPRKIADGNDHWVIALGYFCLGHVGASREYEVQQTPRWMQPNPRLHRTGTRLGQESLRRSH